MNKLMIVFRKAIQRFGIIFGVGYHKHFEIYGPAFLDEKDAKDIAASNQIVFEQRFTKK